MGVPRKTQFGPNFIRAVAAEERIRCERPSTGKRTHKSHIFQSGGGSCIQLRKKRLGIFQVEGLESLCEPAVDGLQEIPGFPMPSLVPPQAASAAAVRSSKIFAPCRRPTSSAEELISRSHLPKVQ
jgi:hypothetical protein